MGIVFAHSHVHGFVKCCDVTWAPLGFKSAATRLFLQQFYTRHIVWTYHLENRWEEELWKWIAFIWRSFTVRFRDMYLCIWKNTHWTKVIYNWVIYVPFNFILIFLFDGQLHCNLWIFGKRTLHHKQQSLNSLRYTLAEFTGPIYIERGHLRIIAFKQKILNHTLTSTVSCLNRHWHMGMNE